MNKPLCLEQAQLYVNLAIGDVQTAKEELKAAERELERSREILHERRQQLAEIERKTESGVQS
jgi:hypothetical protein